MACDATFIYAFSYNIKMQKTGAERPTYTRAFARF